MIDWERLRADLASPAFAGLGDDAALAAIKAKPSVRNVGPARGTADPEQIIAAFTPEEWAAAKALAPNDAQVAWLFDRLMARVEPVSLGEGTTFAAGLVHLVAKRALGVERSAAIIDALTAGAVTPVPFDVAAYGEAIEIYHVRVARKGD